MPSDSTTFQCMATNIIILVRDTGGDLAPMLRIGSTLRSAGLRVKVITHALHERVVDRMNLDFTPIDSTEGAQQFLADAPMLNRPLTIPPFVRAHLISRMNGDWKLLTEGDVGQASVLVVRHMSSLSAVLAARAAGARFVRVFTAVAQITNLAMTRLLISEVLGNEILSALKTIGISSPCASRWDDLGGKADLDLASWPGWFSRPEQDWLVRPRLLGFLNCDGLETGKVPVSIVEAQRRGSRMVLISAGTGPFLPQECFRISTEACLTLGFIPIVATRFPEQLPPLMDKRVMVFDWLPFATVMEYMTAVIHHGGTSVLARAISAGIPQLSLPDGGDRPDTAKRLCSLGLAEMITRPNWTVPIVRDALHRLTTSSSVATRCTILRARMDKDKPDAKIRAAFRLE